MRELALLSFGVAFLVACGGSTDSGTSGDPDSAVVDGATTDSVVVDSAHVDSSLDDAKADSATTDTAKVDSSLDTAGGACGDKTCTAGQICTRTYTTGGACLPCGGDSAACGAGAHCEGACCAPDTHSYSYACKDAPSACGSAPTCSGACGNALCSGGCPCESVATDVVTCHCLAP